MLVRERGSEFQGYDKGQEGRKEGGREKEGGRGGVRFSFVWVSYRARRRQFGALRSENERENAPCGS